jgi:segregation and condensation protein B
MSLKAKLEAVIYAAEEPVTLGQLALLFTADALEWKAEQEAAAAQTAEAEGPQEDGESLPLLEEVGDPREVQEDEPVAGDAGEAQHEIAETETGPEPVADAEDGAAPVVDPATAGEGGAEAAAPTEDAAAADESELKREARQRDREVRDVLRGLLDELIADYAADERGIEVREVAGGYRMATKPECHDAVRGFIKSQKPPLKLSLPALETLAVIAYKQPVTAPEVNEIRGVDSSGVFGSLLSRKLIATAGRKQVVGRPILYKTTREFLLRFGLKDIAELPSMEEFEKLAASELEESDLEAEREAGAAAQPEMDEAASEEDAPETDREASNEMEPVAAEVGPVATDTQPLATPESAGEEAGDQEPKASEAGEPAETEQIPHE